MPGRLDFSFLLGGAMPHGARREPEDPFRVLVVGDFRGRGPGGVPVPAAPSIQRVDLDTFDELFTRLQPRATLAFGGERLELTFGSLDDFHPDALLQRVPALQLLQQERQQLRDPARAAALLGKVTAPASPAAPPVAAGTEGSMFERLLGQGSAVRREPAATGLEQMLARLVRPHLAPVPDPRVPDLLASLEATATGLLREVLHHAAFQQLEASWRGLHWLLQNVECDEDLQVLVLDMTPAELTALAATDDLRGSVLHHLLVERAGAGAHAFSLVVALQAFGTNEADVRTLAAMGALGALGGFPFVATAMPTILGCASTLDVGNPLSWRPDPEAAMRWRALRQSPQAARVGLVLPQFLLRLPYGASTDRIDAMPFEEMPMPPEHARYLWGAPGLAVAMLLSRSFREQGWQMEASTEQEVTGLPAHTVRIGGAPRLQPCAEVLLGERAVTAVGEAGLMVLQSHANRDAARLVQLRSLADPDAGLAGPWHA